jgi:hypothetical protein
LFLVAKGILGPTTLIPDFIRCLTDSEVLIGLSSSLFKVGWTLPQLFIARYIASLQTNLCVLRASAVQSSSFIQTVRKP